MLVYPIARTPLWRPSILEPSSFKAMEDLLGPVRAAALRALGVERTTSALAACLNVSVSSASRHAGALRRAGLVIATRQGQHVLHRRTPLGDSLLTASAAVAPREAERVSVARTTCAGR